MNGTKCRADWMSGAHGMMVHYLPPMLYAKDGRVVEPLRMADEFDIEVFMDAFLSTGSQWLIFTAGQNSGLYNSPNSAIEKYAGPGHCPGRDLLLELATAVKAVGRRFIVYLPCEIRGNTTLQEGFGWTYGADPAENVFQTRWLEVISCWAKRLGPLLDGWWFDGAYEDNTPDLPASTLRLDEWYAAARSGNPDAAVAFNDGCYCGGKSEPHLPGMDYYAGEAEALHEGAVRYSRNWKFPVWYPHGKFCADGTTLRHVLLPVDAFWWHATEANSEFAGSPYHKRDEVKKEVMESPLYEAAYLREFRDSWCGLGAAVTFNAGIYMDGSLGDETLKLFAAMSKCHGCH